MNEYILLDADYPFTYFSIYNILFINPNRNGLYKRQTAAKAQVRVQGRVGHVEQESSTVRGPAEHTPATDEVSHATVIHPHMITIPRRPRTRRTRHQRSQRPHRHLRRIPVPISNFYI